MNDERKHCERIAHELLNGRTGISPANWCTCGDLSCKKYGAFAQVTDLIARERAAARTEALEEAAATLDPNTYACEVCEADGTTCRLCGIDRRRAKAIRALKERTP